MKTDVFGRQYVWIVTTTNEFMSMEIDVYNSCHETQWEAEEHALKNLSDRKYKIRRDVVR
jgi:hypothetical protein